MVVGGAALLASQAGTYAGMIGGRVHDAIQAGTNYNSGGA
jgi:hypothetical protein